MHRNRDLAANVTLRKPEQLSNALFPMTSSDAGKAVDIILLQQLKALLPMCTRPSSKFKSTIDLTLANALSPISRTVEGILMLCGAAKHRISV
jgi:hypothetical protein